MSIPMHVASIPSLIFLVLLLQMVSTIAIATQPTTFLTVGSETFKIRPFNSLQDIKNLTEICKNVYGGRDYVPAMASKYESDPSCDFITVENEQTGQLIAVGNIRNFDETGETKWLEAIRVWDQMRGRGIATAFMKELCNRCKLDGAREILSCTSNDNDAMRKVFGRVDMEYLGDIQWPDLIKMKTLTGWAASDTQGEPENILAALDLEHHIQDEAKLENWEAIASIEELKSILKDMKKYGGFGHLPGLGKLVYQSQDLEESIQKGLVRKLDKSDAEGHPPAVMALIREPAIQSLRSKYVCSIVARNGHDFDSALWEACSKKHCVLLDESNPAFMVMHDGCDMNVDDYSDLLMSLPLKKEDPFVIFRWQLE